MLRALVVLSLTINLVTAGAQALQPATMFVDSSPIGARIVVDGQLSELRTPAVLRDLTPGRHTISLWKSGYVQVTQPVNAGAGKVVQVRSTLPPLSVALAFPGNEEIATPQGPLPSAGKQFRYPAGTYYLSGFEERARLVPVFPDSDLLNTSGWSLTLTSLAAVASGMGDYQRMAAGDRFEVSQLTLALASAAVTDALWYAALQAHKSRFLKESVPQISPASEGLDRAEALFTRGEDALQEGDLAGAEASFSRLVAGFPDSRFVPGTWFRLAKIHSVTGRRDLALGEYRLVAEVFPQQAYHDRARQALADLYEASGRLELALSNLNLVVSDGTLDPEAVEAQKSRLQTALETPATEAGAETEAETAETTPRQDYARALQLFAQGHAFAGDETVRLADLQARLSELGDEETVADLTLVLKAVSAASAAAETGDGKEWNEVQTKLRGRDSWVSMRDTGLGLLGLSTTAALLSAASYDRSPDEASKWIMRGAMGTMALSLFPLLWAEPRQ